MKSPITVFTLVIISLFTVPTFAQDVASQDGSPKGTDMDKQLSQMQEDMNSMLQQIATLRQQSQLQENIHKMQSQIENLQRTTDPKERQKLIQEHLETLQEHMKMIESMSRPEGSSSGRKETAQAVPTKPEKMIYGPSPTGFPGGMMYGPGMMGGPQGYPSRSVVSPPGGTPIPWYR